MSAACRSPFLRQLHDPSLLNFVTNQVGQCLPRHSHQEWLKFLRQIERGISPGVPELVGTIEACVQNHNRNPKPFIWTARASDILAKVVKARARLNKSQSV